MNAGQDFGAVFSFLMTMGIIYFSGARMLKVSRFLKKARTTKGVVVKTIESSPGETGSFHYHVVRFQNDKQEWITQQAGSAMPRALPEGEEIEIMYNPEDPTQVEIYSGRLIYLPLGFLAFGIILFVVLLFS
ncbi:DUF3592 domain-containing protein [Chryseolinea soli]|uniref:DUF3592 domain-containing protein n=1 Tax=Chryseolinea soli TaxID=2321403 RepID=A0A385SRV3_9BACT|nr:DUF3592 domain-containing protein [Chryseolinea soli]AYB32370.1 DUF3592 domain-containing protein [Chryseolinea soli]